MFIYIGESIQPHSSLPTTDDDALGRRHTAREREHFSCFVMRKKSAHHPNAHDDDGVEEGLALFSLSLSLGSVRFYESRCYASVVGQARLVPSLGVGAFRRRSTCREKAPNAVSSSGFSSALTSVSIGCVFSLVCPPGFVGVWSQFVLGKEGRVCVLTTHRTTAPAVCECV